MKIYVKFVNSKPDFDKSSRELKGFALETAGLYISPIADVNVDSQRVLNRCKCLFIQISNAISKMIIKPEMLKITNIQL